MSLALAETSKFRETSVLALSKGHKDPNFTDDTLCV